MSHRAAAGRVKPFTVPDDCESANFSSYRLKFAVPEPLIGS